MAADPVVSSVCQDNGKFCFDFDIIIVAATENVLAFQTALFFVLLYHEHVLSVSLLS